MKPPGSTFGTFAPQYLKPGLTEQERKELRAEVGSHYADYKASGGHVERYRALKQLRRSNPNGFGREH